MGLVNLMFFPLLPIKEPYGVPPQKPGVKTKARSKR
jgi:hypothetical protein